MVALRSENDEIEYPSVYCPSKCDLPWAASSEAFQINLLIKEIDQMNG